MVTLLSFPTQSSRFSGQLTLTAVLSLGLILGFTQSKRDRCHQTVEMHWNNDRDKVLQPGDLPEADHQNDTWVHGSVCHHSISDTFLFLLNNPQMKTSTNHSCSCRCRNLSFDFFTVFVSNGLQVKHRKLQSGTFILQEKRYLELTKGKEIQNVNALSSIFESPQQLGCAWLQYFMWTENRPDEKRY